MHGFLTQGGERVGFFAMLLIGVIAGYVAEKVTASRHGILTNLIVGVAGAFVGGTLARMARLDSGGFLGHLIVATLGAILVLWVWRRVTDR